MNTLLDIEKYTVSIVSITEGQKAPYIRSDLRVQLVESHTGARPALCLSISDIETLLPCNQKGLPLVWDTSATTVQAHALQLAESLEQVAAQLRAQVPNLIGR